MYNVYRALKSIKFLNYEKNKMSLSRHLLEKIVYMHRIYTVGAQEAFINLSVMDVFYNTILSSKACLRMVFSLTYPIMFSSLAWLSSSYVNSIEHLNSDSYSKDQSGLLLRTWSVLQLPVVSSGLGAADQRSQEILHCWPVPSLSPLGHIVSLPGIKAASVYSVYKQLL